VDQKRKDIDEGDRGGLSYCLEGSNQITKNSKSQNQEDIISAMLRIAASLVREDDEIALDCTKQSSRDRVDVYSKID